MFHVLGENISGLNFSGISGLNDLAVVIVSFFIFIWIVCIIRVGKDIGSRTNNVLLQVISIILVTLLSPLVGLPLYLIIRPVGYKNDNIPWREACVINLVSCYNCGTYNPKEYECCIKCGEKLRIKCKQCTHQFPHSYQYCNQCGAPNIDFDL